MYRRYRERRYRRHRNSNYNDPTRRLRSTLRRPSTQIGILLVVALIIYLILQSANQKKSQPDSLPVQVSVSEVYANHQNDAFFLDVRTRQQREIAFTAGFTQSPACKANELTGKPTASYTPTITTLEEI